jgi:tetratricopeptide (TPR) repeat protein/transcriptional regulator with XRE-family HTH domain
MRLVPAPGRRTPAAEARLRARSLSDGLKLKQLQHHLRRQLWAQWIRWNRGRHFWTQADLAERIREVDPQKTSRWERGEQMPGAKSRAALTGLWGHPPWDPEASEQVANEFAGWIAQSLEDNDLRHSLLSALAAAPERPRAGAGGPRGRELPLGTAHFVGRAAELERLSAALAPQAGPRAPTFLITAIDGTAGAGKTELALHWAGGVRDRFPDGELYVDLRGHEAGAPAERDPAEVLSTLLQALNVPGGQIPLGLNQRIGLYRSLLASRRLLVILDNAASSEQVRPLLPGPGPCTVVVTSRNQLSGLATREGLHRVTLGLFTPGEALALLRRVVGAARIDAELDQAQALARHCAHLPLALRMLADRMVLQPHLSLAALADELSDATRRLDALTRWDQAPLQVQTVFAWSYDALSGGARRAFRLLGLWTGPDIGLAAAAALLDSDSVTARQWLSELTSVHLLEESGDQRYHSHDLLRAYAAELARAHEPAASTALALGRVLTWYVHCGDAVGRTLLPRRPRYAIEPPPASGPPRWFASAALAIAWFEGERENFLAALHQASACGEWRLAWELAIVLWDRFAYQNRYWRHMVLVEDLGLAAARQLEDVPKLTWMLGLRGTRLLDFAGCKDTAEDCFRQMSELCQAHTDGPWPTAIGVERLGDDFGRQWLWGTAGWGLGEIARRRGHLDAAQAHFAQGLKVLRAIGDQWMQVRILVGLAALRIGQGDSEEARDHLNEACRLSRETGSRVGVGFSLRALGDLYRGLGQWKTSIDYYMQTIAVCQEQKDTLNQAGILRLLGELHRKVGNPTLAAKLDRQADFLFDLLALPSPVEADAPESERLAN